VDGVVLLWGIILIGFIGRGQVKPRKRKKKQLGRIARRKVVMRRDRRRCMYYRGLWWRRRIWMGRGLGGKSGEFGVGMLDSILYIGQVVGWSDIEKD
jgi:hypothetical protein